MQFQDEPGHTGQPRTEKVRARNRHAWKPPASRPPYASSQNKELKLIDAGLAASARDMVSSCKPGRTDLTTKPPLPLENLIAEVFTSVLAEDKAHAENLSLLSPFWKRAKERSKQSGATAGARCP